MVIQLPTEQRPLFELFVKSTVRIFNPKTRQTFAGVIISEHGLILTCEHALKRQQSAIVRTCELESDWRIKLLGRHKADVIFTDKEADLAVLLTKRPPISIRVAEIKKELPQIGQAVYRVGMDNIPMDSGHIFGYNVDDDIPTLSVSIITEVGASGGPLFDNSLKLVGIVIQYSGEMLAPQTAYAVPIPTVIERAFRHESVRVHLPKYLRI